MHANAIITIALSGLTFVSASSTRPAISIIEPSLTQIITTQATQAALSPVSNVKGAGFDRIIQIWLENTVGLLSYWFIMCINVLDLRIMLKLLVTPICNGCQARV